MGDEKGSSYDCRAVKGGILFSPPTKARTIVAFELEREVSSGISAANHRRGHRRGRVGPGAAGRAGTGQRGLFPGTGSSLVTQNVRSCSPEAQAIISPCHLVI